MLERVIGISNLTRVPRRAAFWLENEPNFMFHNLRRQVSVNAGFRLRPAPDQELSSIHTAHS
jgi:hypothetical protein